MINEIIAGLLIALMYGVGTFLAKIVSEKDPLLQWIIVNILGIIFCIFIIIKYPQKLQLLQGDILLYGIASAILILLGSLLLYYSLHSGRASIVVTLSAIGPAITMILAIVFLKEQVSNLQIFGIILIIIGIIFISMNSYKI
ncbi:EamA family transporter [Methanococcus aeolicus]|nr:EamA family transporter [Methanococcus aeolicus]